MIADRPEVFDSHFHIIDKRFPLIANDGYLPDEFTCSNYLKRTGAYNLVGGAVVSGSFQAFDQHYLLNALNTLGPGFVGVTQLPATATDDEIVELDKAGVRAVRFNLRRGGSESIAHLTDTAARVNELAGWHIELCVDGGDLKDLYSTLIRLPAVSIDHLGLRRTNLKLLGALAGKGARIKASGFGRVDFDIAGALRDLYSANPASLMFGTDLPSTRATRPYRDSDCRLVIDSLGADAAADVLSRNALRFYRVRTA